MTCDYLKDGYCKYWLETVGSKDCRDCIVTRRKYRTHKETETTTSAVKTQANRFKSEDKGQR